MSHISLPLRDCPSFQDALDDYFGACSRNTYLKPHEVSLVTTLRSPENMSDIEFQLKSGGRDGKKRTVELIYTPRPLLNEVDETTAVYTCDASTNEAGHQFEEYSISNEGVTHSEVFKIESWESVCENNGEGFFKSLLRIISLADRSVEDQAWEDLATMNGAFASDEDDITSDIKEIATQKSGGDLDRRAITDLWYATMNAGYCGTPIFFGWNEIMKSFWEFESGCCSDGGLDLDSINDRFDKIFVPNSAMQAHIADPDFTSMALGALQLPVANLYKTEEDGGLNYQNNSDYKRIKIFSPFTGLPMDYMLKDNCGEITHRVTVNTKVIQMPDDMYDTGDRYEGVNYFNRYTINNPA